MKSLGVLSFACVFSCVLTLANPAYGQGTLFVENDKVGIGIEVPRAPLDVVASDGTARILVEETNASAVNRTLFELINRGSVRFIFRNVDTGVSYEMSSLANNFVLSRVGTGGPELIVRANGSVTMGPGGAANFDMDTVGNVTIAGDLTADGIFYPSSRELKHRFRPVDTQDILRRLHRLPITEWSYREDETQRRHIGPVTEDFNQVFELGTRNGRLNAMDVMGVTLAAVQGLSEDVAERDELISKLERRIEALETLIRETHGQADSQ